MYQKHRVLAKSVDVDTKAKVVFGVSDRQAWLTPDFVLAFLATDRGQITDSSADMGCLVGLSLPPVLEITKK